MKNIFSFLFIICMLALSSLFSNKQSAIFSFFKQGECEFTVSNTTKLSFLPQGASVISNGKDVIIRVDAKVAKYVFQKFKKNQLKSFVFKFEDNFENFKKKLNFKYFEDTQVLADKHYYAFFKIYENFVYIKGKKVNAHIVEKEGLLLVGFPIILTSY